MSNKSTFLFTLLGVVIAAITLFYNMTLKPNIDYFQTLTKDVVKLRLSAGYINDICLTPDLQKNAHFYKYMERRNIEREAIITKIIAESYLFKPVISGESFNSLRTFVKWNTDQYMAYIVHQNCPNDLSVHENLVQLEEEIIANIPYGIWDNLKHFYKTH